MKNWVVYLLRCADDSLYCGITNDLDRRIQAHGAGRGAVYTRGRLPVALAGKSEKMTRSDALRLEMKIKKARRELKIALLQKHS